MGTQSNQHGSVTVAEGVEPARLFRRCTHGGLPDTLAEVCSADRSACRRRENQSGWIGVNGHVIADHNQSRCAASQASASGITASASTSISQSGVHEAGHLDDCVHRLELTDKPLSYGCDCLKVPHVCEHQLVRTICDGSAPAVSRACLMISK